MRASALERARRERRIPRSLTLSELVESYLGQPLDALERIHQRLAAHAPTVRRRYMAAKALIADIDSAPGRN
jgi:hypothetical protein